MADTNNSVTIFSNGQAHMRVYRTVKPGEANEISLPFRQSSMEDVLASFNVYNPNLQYARPASFILPDKRATVTVAASLFETLNTLRGVRIKCKRAATVIEGTLFGTDVFTETVNNCIIQHKQLSIQTLAGIQTVPFKELSDLQVADPEIAAEVEKALVACRQKLKPDAVFLNLALRVKPADRNPATEETALIQWVEQLSPWKLSYRLSRQEDGKYRLNLFGVVSNPTDTDWNDCFITLVNGKPLTFISDLDKQTQVSRQGVNLADSAAKGGFIPENGFEDEGGNLEAVCGPAGGGGGPRAMSASRGMMAAAAPSPANFMGSNIAQRGQANYGVNVTAEDVGDFCVYKQDAPMSIARGSASAIPLFQTTLNEASKVLVYDPQKSRTNPFQAIKFKNETKQSLGVGVTVVFEKNLFQGKCIQSPTKPGETAMLYYAEETGVRVMVKSHRSEPLPRRLKVHDSQVISTTLEQTRSTYVIRNVKDEEFDLLIEYQRVLSSESTVVCDHGKQVESLQNGVRFSVKLPAKGNLTVTVNEEFTGAQTYQIGDANSFLGTFIVFDKTIQTDPKIKKIKEHADKVSAKTQEITLLQSKISKATQAKKHLVDIIGLGQNAGNLDGYQADLKTAMTTIKTQTDALEAAEAAKQEEEKKLYDTLYSLSGEWTFQDNKK